MVVKDIEVTSVALMTGAQSTAKIVKSDKKGIRFHFMGEEIEAKCENVVSTEHCTVLGNEKIKIMLIEHFMAACAICHIDAIDVYLTHFELPILDGGAKGWVELFRQNGLEGKQTKTYTIKEPVSYINGKTRMWVVPSNVLNISYMVNFKHKDLCNRWVELTDSNLDEIVSARTFGYLKDLEMLQQAGYGRGASLENTVGLTDEGYTTELLSEYEPAKHKILDLIGDLYLTGFNPLDYKAEIIAKEAGHTVHNKVAAMLKDKIGEE